MQNKSGITKHSHMGIEALRVLAMLMIVSLHYLLFGGVLKTTAFSTNYLLGWFIESFCIVAVNCYVLTSGYFLVKTSSFKFEKAFKLWLQIFFYSVGIFFLFYSLNIIPFSLKELLKSFLPIKFKIVSNKVRKNHNTPIKAYAAKSFCWIALTISGFIYERLLDQSSLYSII